MYVPIYVKSVPVTNYLIKKRDDMETYFTAYTKLLDFKIYYFIKRFSAFPEFKNVSPVMEAYGMHTDFDKACSFAGVTDEATKASLLKEANCSKPTAKIVALDTPVKVAAM
jgi:hypothetical protein